ncbi:coenzyme PQQ synthesis protein D [Clostridium tepidiprofundi DSM 19306]|uniref:Coenzyme PQQ synthesis protein D n=1 Tax=Clostridium tepidiprofundi DSM 19306 TaxID=1121338 RepID=A0A151B032_9CLOT|nr:PqqD family protein [Clostridium tepidiprofundi]KYH33275.1 coenzyme PQQ synthesis protein D [Clostridium tepidiprofundi DSM 19306]
MFNKKNKNKDRKQDNFLLYIPQRKHDDWEVRNGRVYLNFYHNKPVEKFVRWLFKKPYKSDIELDERGTTVWQLMDGKRTVYDISKELSKKFGDDEKTSNQRLIMYLRYLVREGWISFRKEDE